MKNCTKCQTLKQKTDFPINGGRLRSQCKSCVAEKSRLWRAAHPGYSTQYMQKYQAKNYSVMKMRMAQKKQEISDWKHARGCTVCEETTPCTLELHHLDPSKKERNPAQSATLKTFLKEIHNCILLCSNCHRKVHYGNLIITDKLIQIYQQKLDEVLKG